MIAKQHDYSKLHGRFSEAVAEAMDIGGIGALRMHVKKSTQESANMDSSSLSDLSPGFIIGLVELRRSK